MGLSSSKSTTNSTQNQNTTQNETGTTTPVTPDWLSQAAQDYVSKIGSFGQQDPNSFVAGAAPLQQQAWNNAGSLGNWQGQAATAAGMAQQAGQAPANLGGVSRADLIGRFGGGGMGGGAAQMGAGALGAQPTPQAIAGPAHSTPLAPPTNAFSGAASQPTGLVPGTGYSPAPSQPGYAQPRTGYPIGGGPPAAPTGVDPLSGAQTANPASLLTNLSDYQNPYDSQVRQTALSDFDQQSAQQNAQLEAQGARNGAFGGSRFGIAQGQALGDQDRARASLDAGLLDQGFNTATGLSAQDAAMRQQSSMANAAAGNQMTQFNAGQQDSALTRQLAASQLLGQQAQDYGTGTRADLTTMAGLGDQQRAIEQAYAMAGPAQLQMEGQLSGMTPYQILVGQNVNTNGTGTMTGTGTNVTTQSPSIFSMLMQGANSAAQAYAGGMGG